MCSSAKQQRKASITHERCANFRHRKKNRNRANLKLYIGAGYATANCCRLLHNNDQTQCSHNQILIFFPCAPDLIQNFFRDKVLNRPKSFLYTAFIILVLKKPFSIFIMQQTTVICYYCKLSKFQQNHVSI